MLTDDEFTAWHQGLDLSDKAVRTIAAIRSAPPSRLVRSGHTNATERYISRKMNCAIQAESYTVEGARVRLLDNDDDLIEFYDQPPAIWLTYLSPTGKKLPPIRTTMDFFEIRRDGAGWVECKTEQDLLKLTAHNAHHYMRDDEGRWRCPPGEAFAEALRLSCRVFSSTDIDWIYVRNLNFMEDYLRSDTPMVVPEIARHLVDLTRAEPGMTLSELLAQMTMGTPNDVYTLIAQATLHVDLRAAPLAEPRRVRVWAHRAMVASSRLLSRLSEVTTDPPDGDHSVRGVDGEMVVWDGRSWTILNRGERNVALKNDDEHVVPLSHDAFDALVREGSIVGTGHHLQADAHKEATERLLTAGPKEHDEAMQRYRIIAPDLGLPIEEEGSDPVVRRVTTRTKRRWIAAYGAAARRYGDHLAFIALLPDKKERGNRRGKLPPETTAIMDEFRATYESIRAPNRKVVWGQICNACDRAGTVSPSYEAWCAYLLRQPSHRQKKRRMGHRAAYDVEPFYYELTLTTPRHGDRPFEIVHMDHALLDAETVCALTGRNLGKAWLTMATDANARRLLALVLSYQAPSTLSCMMVLREMVRRHGRLPQLIVVDGGPEFKSKQFEQFLATHRVHKRTRPKAKPRFGSVCERLFGTTNTELIHNLIGNTKIMRNVRQVTKGVDPRRQAVWTLEALAVALQCWADDLYDTTNHPALGMSPRAAFAQSLMTTGGRPHVKIPYDDAFIYSTLPSTPTGEAKVQVSRGVKIHNIYYWTKDDSFRNSHVEGTKVPVRYDPLDVGHAYAYVGGRWRECLSEYHAQLHGRSAREIEMASKDIRQRKHIHGQRATSEVTSKRLGEYLTTMQHAEGQLEHLRALANRRTFALIEGGRAATATDAVAIAIANLATTEAGEGTIAASPAIQPRIHNAAATHARSAPVPRAMDNREDARSEDENVDDDLCEEYA